MSSSTSPVGTSFSFRCCSYSLGLSCKNDNSRWLSTCKHIPVLHSAVSTESTRTPHFGIGKTWPRQGRSTARFASGQTETVMRTLCLGKFEQLELLFTWPFSGNKKICSYERWPRRAKLEIVPLVVSLDEITDPTLRSERSCKSWFAAFMNEMWACIKQRLPMKLKLRLTTTTAAKLHKSSWYRAAENTVMSLRFAKNAYPNSTTYKGTSNH